MESDFVVIIIAILLLSNLFPAGIACQEMIDRGRNPLVGFLIGILLGAIGLAIIFRLPPVKS